MSPIRPTVTVVGRRLDAEHYRLRSAPDVSGQDLGEDPLDEPERIV